jgi:predicted house-cleaning noncanonical NTP pyrophosphatase (MazG superfamily)
MIEYDKLVRDRIPEIIASQNKKSQFRLLQETEFRKRLLEKLEEEFDEFQNDGSIEELIDIVEVIEAIVLLNGLDWTSFETQRAHKKRARGGFDNRVLLERAEL